MFGKRYSFLKFAGFDIGVDLSWLFIAILIAWTLALGFFPAHYPGLKMTTYWGMGLLGMLGLFISIVLHEMGHAVMARSFGQPIYRITLFIFGGVAEMNQEPKSPKMEFWVAIAGPLVTVAIIILTFIFSFLGSQLTWPTSILGVLHYLLVVNMIVLIFNLIPAFPLDGGRILRALVWWWNDNLGKATTIASSIGSVFGMFLIFAGFLFILLGNIIGGFWWMILGFFLRQAAIGSHMRYLIEHSLEGEKIDKFMIKEPICVSSPDITIKQFIDQYVYTSYHHLYPVLKDGNFAGYISLDEIKQVNSEEWDLKKINEIMILRSDCPTVSIDASSLSALKQFSDKKCPVLFILENDHLLGILTNHDLLKVISLHMELER